MEVEQLDVKFWLARFFITFTVAHKKRIVR